MDIKAGKVHKTGFVATSEFGKAEVLDILHIKMEEAGLNKHTKKHKYVIYRGVNWTPAGANKVDLYYKVSGKKHKAKVYFIASNGYDNYITSANDATAAANITGFLSQLDAAIATRKAINQKQAEAKVIDAQLKQQKADTQKLEDAKKQKSGEIQKLQRTEAY